MFWIVGAVLLIAALVWWFRREPKQPVIYSRPREPLPRPPATVTPIRPNLAPVTPAPTEDDVLANPLHPLSPSFYGGIGASTSSGLNPFEAAGVKPAVNIPAINDYVPPSEPVHHTPEPVHHYEPAPAHVDTSTSSHDSSSYDSGCSDSGSSSCGSD